MADDAAGISVTQVPEGPPNYPPNDSSNRTADLYTSPESRTGIVKRAMGRTADKLNRSKSSGNKASTMTQSQPSLPVSGHRRIFSLNRSKGKERASADAEADDLTTAQSQLSTSPTSPSLPRRLSGRSIVPVLDEDSPFITPRSPPFGPTRSVFNIFRGDGSLRAGTQTLIQALQAIPWATDDQDNDEDGANQDNTDPDSDEEDKPASWLASSIHTIYRPVARSRRKDRAARSRTEPQRILSLSDVEDESIREEPVLSDEDIEEDFEPAGSDVKRSIGHSLSITLPPLPERASPDKSPVKPTPTRTGSMATVKVQRRARLAEKLRDIFELKGISEVIGEMPCWLLRSVLLQGYMYLTDSYLCFFAHMPSREDQVLKSGSLSKRAHRTKRWIKHWFILKNDVLSWYQSSSDPYFPKGFVDLRYAISCESVGEKDIRIRTNQKTIRLSADSIPSRDEWVKAIRKVMFKAQNMGDSVKIAIPYSAIVDIERSTAMDFSDTIEVKVIDKGDSYSVDSYFFAYFHDLQAALEQIRDAVRSSRGVPDNDTPPAVLDTTVARSPPGTPSQSDRVSWAPTPEQSPKASGSGFRLTSLLKPLQDSLPMSRAMSAPEPLEASDEFTHVSKRSSTSFIPITTSPKSSLRREISPSRPSLVTETSSSSVTPAASYISNHTYPPSSSLSPSIYEIGTSPSNTSLWSVGVPSWLKMPSRRLLSSPFSSLSSRPSIEHAVTLSPSASGNVTEVFSQSTSSPLSSSRPFSGDFGFFSILEAPGLPMDSDVVEKFRSSFAFDEKESLLGYFPGYIFRLLPVYGRLYISTNYFAFKSSGPLASRIRMVLPTRDILSTESSRAFRFGHYGLVVIVRGHEELFFEFADEERRAAFVSLLEKQMEEVHHQVPSSEAQPHTEGQRDALILEEFGPHPQITDSDQIPEPESMSGSLPAVMFTSTSSTFLTFKPKQPLHFTFLTIGSRGDVQPYIALAKGLIADGHKCRIATHGEFKEWIESHGIEFGYVGGDPAELMRICVENGMFTVSFLKESMAKFRGWIDDLLKTSWEACQGTDVLIESPSAMGGYHIAEALKIPYFRAFTMTWSRTRAYPHAFGVPEHKMGGNYNYMSYVLFDLVFWKGTSGQINRWRKNTLGLPATGLDKMEPHKIPFLYNFSPVVVPPPLDWPEWIRVTGYWFLDDANVGAAKWTPPPDLLDFIDTAHKAKKKVVYIGFGSIVVSDPKAMTRTVIDAIVQSGVYAILSKGWSDRLVKTNTTDAPESAEPMPKQIYQISSLPHDWLFKRIDAACHHGGAGTTGASLRAGIPTIIKPFFGDQFFWADRVEALGIGSAVRKLTVPHLTEALLAATTDQKQIGRAKMIGESIRAENGVSTAIEAIYRDLEYARTLIKGRVSAEHRDEGSDPEHATIREFRGHSPSRTGTHSGHSSIDSTRRSAVSDWSVISDQEDAHS